PRRLNSGIHRRPQRRPQTVRVDSHRRVHPGQSCARTDCARKSQLNTGHTTSYDLTVFKLHFGRLTGKAYTKDEMCWGTPSVQTLVAMASVMFQELEEVPMTMVGGLDVHRQQITFDYVDDDGLVHWGQIRPATRKTLRGWLAEHCPDGNGEFALEGCTGWRYVSEELAAAGLGVHLGDPAGARGRDPQPGPVVLHADG